MAIFYFINCTFAAETIKGGKLFKVGNYLQKYDSCKNISTVQVGSFTSNFCAVTIRTATFEKPNESLEEKSKQQFEAKHCRQRQQHQRVFWQSIHDKCQVN